MKNVKAVFGIFKSKSEVENAVRMLRESGFKPKDISVLMPKLEDSQNFAHEKETKAPEGTATGAASGAVLGTGLGWLVGIGALAIPGVGPFIAAGPIVAAIAGAGIGGALGGVTGGLIGLGIPEYVAKRYNTLVNDGGMLISIHTDDSDWREKAKDVLKLAGAHDISSTDEAKPGMFGKKESENAAFHNQV